MLPKPGLPLGTIDLAPGTRWTTVAHKSRDEWLIR